MLSIQNLHVSVNNKPILKGISLDIAPGEVHAIMGPNGSGKTTLGNMLAGRDGYEITDGQIIFQGVDLLALPAHERALKGIFLAMQYPVQIPGVSNISFLKTALNARREALGQEPLDAMDFLNLVKATAKSVHMDEAMLYRAVNEGFSGGEKKRNEVLQMLLLQPSLCVLDETDSGLDIDALQVVAQGVNTLRSPERSFIVVTHYQRLLDYIVPDKVHVLAYGKIVKSGDKTLALELEEKGYAWLAEKEVEGA